ncbi:hypothetical protein E4K67_09325 [Desulfosporosinus fructosivorans]|uniref:Uncharacterized protein n=1 Tax=Desulfosporosinus fructosivorans TaxID=2018669 RepID=A0A4Z0R940_9FIRM|nr:hypothetical protein [Desulfosporosinus fructosivorans]TGE38166.1 hypothetical protein E4K67_09325 [Desulfosporosinus fructosivorans]
MIAVVGIPIDISRFDDLSTMMNIKHVLMEIFCVLFGVTSSVCFSADNWHTVNLQEKNWLGAN